MSRLKRWLKVLGKVVLVLVVTDLALTLVLGRMVRSEIARLRASGYPTTIAEIAPKKIPDSGNAAVIYAKAFDEMGKPLSLEDEDAFSSLMSPEERTDDPAAWQRGMQILERRKHVIALIEEACSRPKSVFPVEWEKGGAALFPHLAEMRALERLLAADAIASALDGRTDAAVRSLESGIRLSESLAKEPSIISQLVRYDAIRIQARTVRVVAQNVDIDAVQARRLYDTLGAVDLNPGYSLAMRTELVFGLWSFDEFRRDPNMIREYMGFECMCIDPTGDPRNWHSLIAPLHSRTPIVYADELVYLKAMEDRVRNTVLPYRVLKRKRPDLLRDPGFAACAIGSECLLYSPELTVTKRDDAIATLNGGQMFCALLAYKDRFGGYPRSLGELRSKLGWKLPDDPYSGRDFVYRRQGNGFIFYSVGVNLKDDGGISYDRPPEKPEKSRPPEVPPPGYDPTVKPAPAETPPTADDMSGAVVLPAPGSPDRTAPPPARIANPPYSTVDGRRSEDIIWQLDR